MNTVFIYGLFDPRNYQLRYIGKAKDLKDRLRNHLRLANDPRCKHHHNYRWIRQLLDEGLEPSIEALEEVSEDKWKEAESAWIADCRKFGVNLTNMTSGGDSFPDGYIPHNKGKTITNKQKAQISKANTGKVTSGETRLKQSLAHTGKTLSKEHREKIGKAGLGKVMSNEAKQKIGNANRGKPLSAETKEKMKEARKGRKLSEEHKRNIAKASTGRKHTEESKQKMREVQSKRRKSNEN